MFDPKETRDFFETSAKVLLRCWLFGFVVLLIWLGVVLFAGNVIESIPINIFGLTKHELNVISYCGMGFLEVIVILFLFIPWLSIKLVLRPGNRGTTN